MRRFEGSAGQVYGCGLQSAEEKASGSVVDLGGKQKAHDLHKCDLDGVGVLEDGESYRDCSALHRGFDLELIAGWVYDCS